MDFILQSGIIKSEASKTVERINNMNTVFSKNEADYKLPISVVGPSEIDSFFSNKDYDAWIDACDCILDNLENVK